MIHQIRLTAIAFIAAIFVSAFTHPHSWYNAGANIFGPRLVRLQLQQTINQFNKHYAGFYDTGGSPAGLNAFPAENLVKRRIFQDIATWNKKGKWLVQDLHDIQFIKIELTSPILAKVTTFEQWDVWIKEVASGARQGRRLNLLNVVYHLRMKKKKWIVTDYEVSVVDPKDSQSKEK